MRWLPAPWRRRRRVLSRPRVALAASAAHQAFITPTPLGSALAGPALYLVPGPWPASGSAALAASVVLATTRAGRAMGRAPEGLAADVVRAWAASQEGVARPADPRRRAVWDEIDATLSALRAS